MTPTWAATGKDRQVLDKEPALPDKESEADKGQCNMGQQRPRDLEHVFSSFFLNCLWHSTQADVLVHWPVLTYELACV